jgi:predicted ester cyclase
VPSSKTNRLMPFERVVHGRSPPSSRAAFPDLNFWGTADLTAEGDYVVGQWEGGGTHTGDAFSDLPIGALPAGSGKTMRFMGISVLRVENGLIAEELGLDDGVTVLKQLELIPAT